MLTSRRWMCVLLVGAMVGTVQAGAVKIMDFVPVLHGETQNGEVDGLAIFNAIGNSGTTEARVTVMGLAPATTYRVVVRGWGGGNTPQFETNAAGNGHVKTTFSGDITSGGVDVMVMVYIDDNGDQLVQPEEIRAIGCVSGACTLPFTTCGSTDECQDGFYCSDEECVTINGQGYCSVAGHICTDTDPCTIDLCIGNVGETDGEVGSCDHFNNCP